MICRGCGTELQSNQAFCPNCGTNNEAVGEFKKKCVSCGKEFPGDRQFCNTCGGNLVPIQQNVSTNIPIQNQMPPYQTQGQMPPQQWQMPPNMMPPYPGQPYYGVKTKSNALPIFIIVGLLVIILGGAIAAVAIINNISKKDKETLNNNTDIVQNDTKDETANNNDNNDITVAPTAAPDTTINGDNVPVYDYVCNYTELPNVVSLDYDKRFVFNEYTPDTDGVVIYTYYFDDTTASDADLYTAVNDYCAILSSEFGYVYDGTMTQMLNEQTGTQDVYYANGDSFIGVNANVEANGRYIYVLIFDRSAVDGSGNTSSVYPNYNDYIDGRSTTSFEQSQEVIMENGIEFYLNDIYLNYNDDGTATIDANMNLAANFEGSDLYSDDFMVVPKDADGNILADATKISSILDSDGNSLSTPVVLSTSYYNSYKISFSVPSTTEDITFYGVNIELDSTADSGASASGPVYALDITFEQ